MRLRRILRALHTLATLRGRPFAAAALTLALMAVAMAALTLTWGDGGSQQVEAGAPPPTSTATPTQTPTPTLTPTPTPTPTTTPTPTITPTPTKKPPEFNAVAKVIADSADLVEGPMSRGRLGDYLLANTEIQVVIQDVQRNLLNVGQFGAQIIDADLVRVPSDPERDSFEEWAFGINIENTGHYTSVSIVNDGSNGQPAVIRASGVDDLLDFTNPSSLVAGLGFTLPAAQDDVDLPVEITTDYILAPNDSFVRVETTIRNTDLTTPVETFISDFLGGSGQVELFQPGYGFGEPQATTACDLCNFVAWSGEDQADGVSYGYIHEFPNTTTFADAGVVVPLLGESVLFTLTGVAPPNFTIAPQDEITVARYFAVGDGSVGSIVDIRNQILGLATGTIEGTVTRAGQPVEGADVAVLGDPLDGPGTEKNVVSHYRTDANGQYEGTLPPGDYAVQAHLDGHLAASPDPANVTVTDGGTTVQDFTIPEAGRVRVTVVDENSAGIAGKVSVVGFDPYPDPENFQDIFGIIQNSTGVFGEITKDRLPFGLAKVLFVDQTGDSGEFFIEPGDYRVVVSHGTEYSIFEQDITVTAGALTTVNAQIARVIDTTGFVSGEFHIHQLDSPDSAVTYEQRIISALAEGVDFFTPSDHEHRSDLAPVISSLGVGSLISVAVNNENTTPDYGHFNAWPLTIDSTKVNNGALDWGKEAPPGEDFPSFGNYMMPPAEIIANLLADPGVDTVQINHIDSFFGPGGLAVDTAFEPPQDFADNLSKRLDPSIPNLFDDGFTALEIWQGTSRNEILGRLIGRNLGDWFNMMNQGIVRTGIAVSDTHKRVINQSGFPRTMIASPTDDPGALGAIAETLAGNVNAGRTTGTNAPFVEVTAEATSTGETGGLALGLPTLISTTDGSASITVDIQSPLWAEFDRVEYYINEVPFPDDFDWDPTTPPYWNVAPDVVQVAGVDFTVSTVDDFPLIPGAGHFEATTSLNLSGLTDDTWVVVLVRGTDGVSKPIFPVVPNDIDQATNLTLADLIDGNLGEDGVPATAFTNPLFIDIDGNAVYDPSPVDSDRDGCTNDREVGPKSNAQQGGGRSPSNFWDFYDTPDADGVKDKVVNIFDVFRVADRFLANDAGAEGTPADPDRYTDPLTVLTEANGGPGPNDYHPAFDHSGQVGENTWEDGPPDGTINIFDVFRVASQYLHRCT